MNNISSYFTTTTPIVNNTISNSTYVTSNLCNEIMTMPKSVCRVGVYPLQDNNWTIPYHMLKYILKCTNLEISDIENIVAEDAGAIMVSHGYYVNYVFFQDNETLTKAYRNWNKRKIAS